MANPQKENGHTDIAHEILEALWKINLSPYETRILFYLFRKIYGWHKKRDQIALTQFSNDIGIDRRLIFRTLKSLESKNLIVISQDDGGKTNYQIQKNYEKWNIKTRTYKKSVISQDDNGTVISQDDKLSSPKMTKLSSPEIHTKTNIKENKRKDIMSFSSSVIDYFNQKTGKNFRPKSKEICRLISARYNDGFTLEDFKTVIDKKTSQWLNDPKMDAYLRPKTLFAASNFESYLNERGNGNGNATKEDWEYRIDDTIRAAKKFTSKSKNTDPQKISETPGGSIELEVNDF